MAIRCGRSGHSHDTVAEVRACQIPTPTKTLQMAGAPNGLRSFETTKTDVGYTSARTGPVIKAAKPKPFDSQNLEDGFYEVQGRVYKVIVAVHGSGRKYAKLWNFDTGEWDYNRGGIREIRPEHRMTAERRIEVAKSYGLNPDSPLYGRCWMCHRPLTDETSISLGIGPICKDK
jgi:hypothetical protein